MKSVQLFGKMLAFSRLKIQCELEALDTALKEALVRNEHCVPVVLESALEIDLEKAIDILWTHNVAVIGVVDGVLSEQAKKRKLAIFPSDGKRIERLSSADSQAESNLQSKSTVSVQSDEQDKQAQLPHLESASPTLNQTAKQTAIAGQGNASLLKTDGRILPSFAQKNHKIHRQMVRSGQALHHIGGDLIVLASVNKGAEVATDYNLHIYGKGQGRLVAGATGDEEAHIFCQNFDPSLVSVAGTYCLYEDIPKEMIGKSVQVSFSREKGLIFTLIGA